MGINWAGVTATVSALARPAAYAPRLIVPDISHLDWAAFKAHGVTGVVIDKDNCITKPHDDALVPHLNPAWRSLLSTFSPANVLVVSNSAGTRKDSLLLQAESVSRHLGVPVLVHSDPKPSRTCARSIRAYFDPPRVPPPSAARRLFRRAFGRRREDLGAVRRLLVIGDRLTTDVILAQRLASLRPIPSPSSSTSSPPLPILTVPILTTTLHASEGLGTSFLRFLETTVVRAQIRKRGATPLPGPWDSSSWNPSNNWRDVMGYGSRKGGWADVGVDRVESAVEHVRMWGALKSMGIPAKLRLK
ncbi:hypothetical protein RQP46_000220 [Phenoliferia psychrophenolica]